MLAMAACSKRAEPPPPPPPEPPHDAAPVARPSVEISRLPVCATASDPLAAICQLGQPASAMHLECPLTSALIHEFDDQRHTVTWGCDYLGKPRPAISRDLSVAFDGPLPRDGEVLKAPDLAWTTPRFAATASGPIEVVKLTLRGADPGKLAAQVRAWGCVGTDHRLDCGSWRVTISALDDQVWLRAGHFD